MQVWVPLKSSFFIAEFQTNSSSFFSLSWWNKDFSPFTYVSDAAAVGLQGRNQCRRLPVVNLFKRTFEGPSLNGLFRNRMSSKINSVLRSLMHPISLATFEKPGPGIQQKRRATRSSSTLRDHPPSPRVTPWPVCLLKDNPVAPQTGFLPRSRSLWLWLWLWHPDWLPAQLYQGDLYHPALWKLFHFL